MLHVGIVGRSFLKPTAHLTDSIYKNHVHFQEILLQHFLFSKLNHKSKNIAICDTVLIDITIILLVAHSENGTVCGLEIYVPPHWEVQLQHVCNLLSLQPQGIDAFCKIYKKVNTHN